MPDKFLNSNNNSPYDAVIIGAGISGLCIGWQMKSLNKNFLILEKSKGVGGRMATRRVDEFTFDHGAQFIKIKNDSQDAALKRLPPLLSLTPWFEDSDAHFFAKSQGMTQIAKSFLLSSNIILGETISHLNKISDQHWEVLSQSGKRWMTKQIYLTSPLPQTLKILNDSGVSYPLDLKSISYHSACVGLFGFADHIHSDRFSIWPKYMQNVSDQIFSISNQLSKGVSSLPAISVVMQPNFSQSNFDQTDEIILQKIEIELNSQNKFSIPWESCKIRQLKKWRYSHPKKIHPNPFVSLENQSLFLVGDAFGGASILGSIFSALSVLK